MSYRKKIIPILLIILFVAFYIGYSFSERGKIYYTAVNPENYTVKPNLNSYSSGQEVEVSFLIQTEGRKRSLFRPLLETELVVSTDLRNLTTYIIEGDNNERIEPSEFETDTYQGFEYKVIHFKIPREENKKLEVNLKGRVPQINNKKAILAHIVQRNFYPFESEDIYKNKISEMVK